VVTKTIRVKTLDINILFVAIQARDMKQEVMSTLNSRQAPAQRTQDTATGVRPSALERMSNIVCKQLLLMKLKVMVKQSHYRPGEALRDPGG